MLCRGTISGAAIAPVKRETVARSGAITLEPRAS